MEVFNGRDTEQVRWLQRAIRPAFADLVGTRWELKVRPQFQVDVIARVPSPNRTFAVREVASGKTRRLGYDRLVTKYRKVQ